MTWKSRSDNIFQSTLSVRRATDGLDSFAEFRIFQSTLSVRRATCRDARPCPGQGISIHALRKESDPMTFHGFRTRHISIHALRKESDIMLL